MGDRDALLDTACDELQHFLRISAPRTEVVTSLGLTLHQFRALVIVYSQEGCTTTDLAEQVGVQLEPVRPCRLARAQEPVERLLHIQAPAPLHQQPRQVRPPQLPSRRSVISKVAARRC